MKEHTTSEAQRLFSLIRKLFNVTLFELDKLDELINSSSIEFVEKAIWYAYKRKADSPAGFIRMGILRSWENIETVEIPSEDEIESIINESLQKDSQKNSAEIQELIDFTRWCFGTDLLPAHELEKLVNQSSAELVRKSIWYARTRRPQPDNPAAFIADGIIQKWSGVLDAKPPSKEGHTSEEQRSEKWDRMKVAFTNSRHETLEDLLLHLLIHLAIDENIEVARKKVGISMEEAESRLEELNNLDLIYWQFGTDSYEILPELKAALEREGLRQKVQSIFGSNKALEAYRLLKRKYLFVFPEILISNFIDIEHVKHLFVTKWHEQFYRACRADFVVCNSEGIPNLVIEFQGGYHQDDEKQKERDEFKRKILHEVGLPLEEYTSADLSG